jgi:tight adherence protein B
MSLNYSLFVVFGFLAVVLLLEGLSMLWTNTSSPEVKRIQRRLRVMAVGDYGSAADVSFLKQRLLSTTPGVQRFLLQLPKVQHLDRLLLQAGSSKTVAHLLGVCVVAGFGGLLLGGVVLRWSWLVAVWAGALLAVLPIVWLVWRRSRRLSQIGSQLPDAMDLIGRALRAGHAFPAALAMVGNEAQEPIAGEFKTTFDEINFGIATQSALINLATRVPIADLRYFVVAVSIQLETGGNLAELLGMLANLIRERFKLFGKIRVLAAEGKLSAYILVALPFFMAGALQIVNPGYMDILFTDPVGIRLVMAALGMMVVGAVVMWRIIDIRV